MKNGRAPEKAEMRDTSGKQSVSDAAENRIPAKEKSAAESAFENFWYHYKWHTIAAIVAAAFLIIAFSQMAGRKEYDAHVLYTGPKYLDKEICLDIIASMTEAAEAAQPLKDSPVDYNGDGALTVDFNKFIYVSPALAEQYKEQDIYFNGLENANSRGDFDNMLVIGEYVILLVDRSLYEETAEAGVYCTWEETVGKKPEKALDDCGILLSDLDIGHTNGFRQLPEDTVLCCRKKSYVNALNKKVQNEDMYRAEVALFCQLVEYRK